MKATEIILVPETHWDREWYSSFQKFRARLVLMMDKLLSILDLDSSYANFTFDGQTIPIEDYLEVKPEKEEEIKKFVREGRLSIGPFYVLPDEFLISGESLIRNLLIGHQIAQKFGRVMKAGYIPDPFGHIAQLPQILKGFEIPSVIFWRGFGDEFEALKLNMEFIWNSPGKAASILAIHLIMSYGSLADLKTKQIKGRFKPAIRKIKSVVSALEKHTATPYVLLNNGSDHHEAVAEIPAIINQWNEEFPNKRIVQRDFEYYANKVLKTNAKLKEFEGELRGGKYAHLLSGVLSARMWIKQRNTQIEYLYEKYAEPFSTIAWIIDRTGKFEYPQSYFLTGIKELQKNHPHDSICGCSIDQVHEEMKTRFDWSEQIALELLKNAIISLSDKIQMKKTEKGIIPIIVINPLPWNRNDVVRFNGIFTKNTTEETISKSIRILNNNGEEIAFQTHVVEEEPRYTQESNVSYEISFIARVPSLGYRVYYIESDKASQKNEIKSDDFKITSNTIENQYYKIELKENGQMNLLDKSTGILHEDTCFFEDVGDWGDEYDYSGPNENQKDLKFTSQNLIMKEISPLIDGPSIKTLHLKMALNLPVSLTPNRNKRSETLIENKIDVFISLYKEINRIDFKIKIENKSKDHRIRILFPSNIKATTVHADGHFYVIERSIDIQKAGKWAQDPLPMNHQKDFIAVQDSSRCMAVLNKGLPEYEAIKNQDGSITLAITLLRCVEWLSRGDLATRKSNAGPDLKTPGAQCLGTHEFELSLIIENGKGNWLDAEIPCRGKEFNNPLKILCPMMIETPMRLADKIYFAQMGILSYFMKPRPSDVEHYLPENFSFLKIENKKIQLSALKKAERSNELILRCYNLSNKIEESKVVFNEFLKLKSAELVNFLEEIPKTSIKAQCKMVNENSLWLQLQPHVIATIKIKY
ncbi:MAG: alpha-mannosidase [Promethearchaeota archaeon]